MKVRELSATQVSNLHVKYIEKYFSKTIHAGTDDIEWVKIWVKNQVREAIKNERKGKHILNEPKTATNTKSQPNIATE